MKVIGLFREINHGCDPSLQTIHNESGVLSDDEAKLISKYLRNGIPVIDIMGASIDPLDQSIVMPGGPSLVSDGDWVWRQDLAYFVEKYKVRLPKDFVIYALKKGTVSVDGDLIMARSIAVREAYEAGMKGK